MTGTPQEVARQLLAWGDDPQTRAQAAAVLCLERGEVLPVSEQDEGCGCGEFSRCRAGQGPVHRPNKVTFAECIQCVLKP